MERPFSYCENHGSDLCKLLKCIYGDSLSMFFQVGFACRRKGFADAVLGKNVACPVEIFRRYIGLVENKTIFSLSRIFIQSVYTCKKSV